LEITVKLLDKNLPVPCYAHDGDAGCDLYSRVDIELKPGQRALIPTGIAVSIPDGYAGFVQPRSGLALKHGISIVNTPGTIDSKYRGEVGVILINLDLKESFKVNRGDKIAQLIIQKVENTTLKVVAELDDTLRGSGGFGSTGR
jgi:dUTP pyrophosphatase